jgi:hypothetical protein
MEMLRNGKPMVRVQSFRGREGGGCSVADTALANVLQFYGLTE